MKTYYAAYCAYNAAYCAYYAANKVYYAYYIWLSFIIYIHLLITSYPTSTTSFFPVDKSYSPFFFKTNNNGIPFTS